jgi:hypothetical protein
MESHERSEQGAFMTELFAMRCHRYHISPDAEGIAPDEPLG